MDPPTANIKPDPETNKVDSISIKVLAADGEETVFRLKRQTKLKKMIDTYCQRTGKTPNLVRFTFEGQRIKADDTPESLEMEDGDTIDVFIEQIGGGE